MHFVHSIFGSLDKDHLTEVQKYTVPISFVVSKYQQQNIFCFVFLCNVLTLLRVSDFLQVIDNMLRGNYGL